MSNPRHEGSSEAGRQPRLAINGLLFAAIVCFWTYATCAQERSTTSQDAITVEGTVRDVSGKPATDALIFLEPKGGAGLVRTKSDAAGHFTLTLNESGTYSVRAEKMGVGSAATEAMRLEFGDAKRCDLVLEAPSASRSASATPLHSPSATGTIDFNDEPNFTVAGVTDWSNAGLHGSGASTRTSDALTKETLALKSLDSEKKASVPLDNSYQSALKHREAGDFERAREEARNSLATAETADGHRLLGDLDERLGDPLAAVSEFARAARMEPSERNYFAWGTELLLHKAAQPAAEVFAKGSSVHPKSSRLLAGLGVALFAAGSYEEAAQRLCAASDLRPLDPAPYLFLGEIEKSSSTPLACSQERLARFAREQPQNAQANYYYAISLWKGERESQKQTGSLEAEKYLEKAVQLDPKFAEAYLQLGIVLAAHGDFALAIENYKKALAVDSRSSDTHYRLGLAYKRAGDEVKARQEFEAYQQARKSEATDVERQRRNLKQFSIIIKDQSAAPTLPNSTPH
jgi:tetratricopeptide (TPR) repeat protein